MDGLSLRYSNYWSLAFWISLGLSLVFFNSPDEGGDISKGLLLVATSLVCFLVAFGLYLDAKGYRWPVAILLLLVPMLSGVIAIILPNRGEPSAGEHRRPIKLWWPASTLRTLTIIMVPMLTFALTDGIRQVEAAPPTVRSPLISHEALLKFGMQGPDDLSFSRHASFRRLEACGVLIEKYSGMMGR